MTLGFEVMALPSSPGLSLVTYVAEPGTASADAMNLLRSWTADSASTDIDAARRRPAKRRTKRPLMPR